MCLARLEYGYSRQPVRQNDNSRNIDYFNKAHGRRNLSVSFS